MKDCIDFKNSAEGNKIDFNYFVKLQNYKMPDAPEHSAAMWDKRAETWEEDYGNLEKDKSDDRIRSTVDYLKNHGILKAGYDVADIGCGPGRFAAAFAQIANHVTGIDISPKMIQYGHEYVQREQLDNVSFRVCDFQTLDIDKENLAGKFDLVFSSNTPAIHGIDGLYKLIRMSRKYCCNITHIHSENELESRIMKEVFGRKRPKVWSGPWFYSLFNTLFLAGYYPEATYYKRHKECAIKPGQRRVQLFMEQMLEPDERNTESMGLIERWLHDNADPDGFVKEVSDVWFGRILWDVDEKTTRASYERPE